MVCSSVGPQGGHKCCKQICSSVGSCLHRSAGPDSRLLQHGLSTGSQSFMGIHLLWYGVLHRLEECICFSIILHGLKTDRLPHCGLRLYSTTWSTDLGVCRDVALTFSLSLSWLQLYTFSPLF